MSACLSIALVASSAARAAAIAGGRTDDFTVSPSSTRRRVASESVGISGWFSAHFTMEARSTGAARNPIMGSRPVAGRPRFFGLQLQPARRAQLCVDILHRSGSVGDDRLPVRQPHYRNDQIRPWSKQTTRRVAGYDSLTVQRLI